ncbi:MBOAT family O-acyltransferase [Flavobacterium soli]|uniref:MBOAT family O-acyltransferase n=1 Tax=Flavobacterium soli TaxID=344881 RepID=UPI0004129724|nr:MBOAT family O-acyltransferase [Flavobacterium soli]
MFFNSTPFAIFLPIVFVLYWFVFNRNKTSQNSLLIIASYFFYACWDWRFLFLLLFSTGLDYITGLKMYQVQTISQKKFWFWLSISINLGFLGFFKYYNFFVSSFADFVRNFGLTPHYATLQIILPVGISFYTFHGLSYVIDIYKNRITPEKNIIDYSLFVSYFPLLVAGPIERATHLLPQVKIQRRFNFKQAKESVYQILWGLIKKVVIADSCAQYANAIFDDYENMNTFSLILGAVYFAFQIYGDFSGYSDIALGTSKLFGINLLKNFDYPYFSRDIAEFWRRWHISLSSWFKDYLYIPLGGSKGGVWIKVRNTFIIFLVSGFWHGSNWTFIVWGFLNALYFLPLLLSNKNKLNTENIGKLSLRAGVKVFLQIIATFLLTSFAWIFFRSRSLSEAFGYIKRMLLNMKFDLQYLNIERYNYELLVLLLFFIFVEWIHRYKKEPFTGKYSYTKVVIGILVLILFGVYTEYKSFIYFQF